MSAATVEIKNIIYTNNDNSTNELTVFSKNNDSPIVFLILSAMGIAAKYYDTLARHIATQNYIAITTDYKGIGKSSIRPSTKVNYSYTNIVNDDLNNAIITIQKEFANKKIIVIGHSLGGQMACLHAAKYSNAIAGIILCTSCSVYYKGWIEHNQYAILVKTQFVGLVARLLGYFPGKKIGFGGLEAKSVMVDWSNQARTGNYILLNDDFNYEEHLQKVSIPIMAISLAVDDFSPKKAVDYLLDKMPNAKSREHIHLLPNDANNDDYNHFNWPKKPSKIFYLMENWTKQNF